MGKVLAPRLSRRVVLGLGFGFQIVSAIALAATWFGMSNIPFPIMAAAAELIGMLVFARVIWDYRAEISRLERPDPDHLRLRLSTCLGGAVMIWTRPDLTIDRRVEVSNAIIALLTDALGAGESAAFYFAVRSDQGEKYLLDLIRRCPQVTVAPAFKAESAEALLLPFLPSTLS